MLAPRSAVIIISYNKYCVLCTTTRTMLEINSSPQNNSARRCYFHLTDDLSRWFNSAGLCLGVDGLEFRMSLFETAPLLHTHTHTHTHKHTCMRTHMHMHTQKGLLSVKWEVDLFILKMINYNTTLSINRGILNNTPSQSNGYTCPRGVPAAI